MRQLGFAVIFLLVLGICFAEIPHTINYQGKITNSAGVGLDGTYSMTFRIFNAPTGGSELWSETIPSVSIHKGLFDVVLGELNPIELPFDTVYWLQIEVGGEILSPRIKLSSVGYAYRSEIADSVVKGVSSLNSLTGNIRLVGEGGITIDTSGSEIIVNLTLESGDCPNTVDLTGGSATSQYVPVNLQTFSQSIGQFLVLGSEMSCTGGRIYRMTLYTNLTSGTISDIDVWLDNVYVDNLSAGSIPPSGEPDAANVTLTINSDGSVVIDLPHGFLYTGHNILVTIRKNSTSGIGALWLGYNTSPRVNARYNDSSADFPLPSTANFRPNVKFDFTPPELPDIVTNVNGITDSVVILGGTDIDVNTDALNHTITINYTGTGGGSGGFQQLRANGGPWLSDSVTFVNGTNVTLEQTGDSIIINASGDNWGTQVVHTSPRLTGNGTASSPLDLAQQGATVGQVLKWNGTAWVPGNDSVTSGGGDNWGSQVVQHDATLAGDGTSANPLKIAQQGASVGQVLKWNGTTWAPADDATGGSSSTPNLSEVLAAGNSAGSYNIDMNGRDIRNTDDLYVNDIQAYSSSQIDFYDDIDMNGYSICLGGECRSTWPSSGGGTPGGSDGQIQYNNSGSFGGARLYWDDSENILGIGGTPYSVAKVTVRNIGSGDWGIEIVNAGNDGIYVNSPSDAGVYVADGVDGFQSYSPSDDGVEVDYPGGNCYECDGSPHLLFRVSNKCEVYAHNYYLYFVNEKGKGYQIPMSSTTERWIEHIGSGRITNGFCKVSLPKEFIDVTSRNNNNLHVIITPTSPIGTFWVEKADSYFVVYSDIDTGQFDYRVVAKIKGNENVKIEPIDLKLLEDENEIDPVEH